MLSLKSWQRFKTFFFVCVHVPKTHFIFIKHYWLNVINYVQVSSIIFTRVTRERERKAFPLIFHFNYHLIYTLKVVSYQLTGFHANHWQIMALITNTKIYLTIENHWNLTKLDPIKYIIGQKSITYAPLGTPFIDESTFISMKMSRFFFINYIVTVDQYHVYHLYFNNAQQWCCNGWGHIDQCVCVWAVMLFKHIEVIAFGGNGGTWYGFCVRGFYGKPLNSYLLLNYPCSSYRKHIFHYWMYHSTLWSQSFNYILSANIFFSL